MTDEAGAAPAPAPAPASPDNGAGASEQATPDNAYSAVQRDTPAAQLTALQRDPGFFADWSGDNGREAQVVARDQKSALLHRLHGPADDPASEWVPEQLQDAHDSQNSVAKATAEAMQPAADPSEYSFNFVGSDTMEISEIAELNEIASEASFSAGASPAYARATIEYVDQALSKATGEPPTEADLQSAMARQYGSRLPDVQANARETLSRMPERSQQWVTNTFERLPASDGA